MDTTIDLTKIDRSYEEIEKQRNALRGRVNQLRSTFANPGTLVDALQNGGWELKLQELSTLEEQLLILDNFLRQKKDQQHQIMMVNLQEQLEKSCVIMDQAEEREAELLGEIDQIYQELAKKGKQLLALRKATLLQIPDQLGVLNTLESKQFLKRKDLVGKVGWDLQRAFYTYEIIRGRHSVFEAPSQW